MAPAMVCSRPDELTAFPRQRPPAARMIMVQRKLLKSSFVRIQVPKKRTSGMIAMTPMSPNVCSSWWLTHQRMMVTTVTMLTNHWTPENLSLTDRMGTIVVPRPGWNVASRRHQISRIEIMQTGSAIKNQIPQLILGYMFSRAIIFCGEAIGDAAPPIFAARAIPKTRALEKLESTGRFRNMGYPASEKHEENKGKGQQLKLPE